MPAPHAYAQALIERVALDQARAEELRRLLAEFNAGEPSAAGARVLPLPLSLALLSECARLAVRIVGTLADLEQVMLLLTTSSAPPTPPDGPH